MKITVSFFINQDGDDSDHAAPETGWSPPSLCRGAVTAQGHTARPIFDALFTNLPSAQCAVFNLPASS